MRFAGSMLALLTLWPITALDGRQLSEKEQHEVRVEVRKYARCVIRKHHDEGKTVLLSDANNYDILHHFAGVVDSSCMLPGYQMKFPADFYRYAMAEALVQADFLSDGPKSFDDRLPLAHPPFPDQSTLDAKLQSTRSSGKRKELQGAFDETKRDVALSRYGECIVRTNPEGTRLWILTPPDGPEETSRIKALMPAFAHCLSPGSTVKFGREQLRGAVALNYFRLANATPHPGLGAAH